MGKANFSDGFKRDAVREPQTAPAHVPYRHLYLRDRCVRASGCRLVTRKPSNNVRRVAGLADGGVAQEAKEPRARAFRPGFPVYEPGLGVLPQGAHTWSKKEILTRQCVAPVNGVLEERRWDVGSTIFEHRILRPLVWLGFLEMKLITPSERPYSRSYLYRKSPAFDRTLEFDVKLECPVGVRH